MRRKMRICSWMAARRLFLFTGQPWAYLRNLSTGNSLGFLLTVDRWCIIKIKEEILSIFHHCSTKEKKKGKWRWNSGGWHEEFFDLEWRLVLEEICKFISGSPSKLSSRWFSFSWFCSSWAYSGRIFLCWRPEFYYLISVAPFVVSFFWGATVS